MKYDFSYNGKVIAYEIIHKNVKNINIRVKPNGEVVVSCSPNVDNKIIEIEMIKRANWLINTIEQYKNNIIEFNEVNHKLVDGEAFLLLGRILMIKNIETNEFKVEFDNNYLYIYRQDKRGIKQKFIKWYNEFIQCEFSKMLDTLYMKYQKYNVEKPKLVFKNMTTRWGTCNIEKAIITLNTQLIKVDPFLTEYVLCHELTHLIYSNHSNEFYSFLTTIIPDWKQREKILNNIFINKLGGL